VVLLRDATAADAAAIAEIWHRGWRDGHIGHVPEALLEHRGLGEFARRVAPRLATTTVAELDGRVVGFVTVDGDEAEQVYVDRDARGTGVAGQLLSHAEAVIGASYPTAWLAVVAGNARARAFYARQGWVDAGAFDYYAETAAGPMLVPSHRYEKTLRGAQG
jgi:GNAT superfamily N-acetyltransferase